MLAELGELEIVDVGQSHVGYDCRLAGIDICSLGRHPCEHRHKRMRRMFAKWLALID